MGNPMESLLYGLISLAIAAALFVGMQMIKARIRRFLQKRRENRSDENHKTTK